MVHQRYNFVFGRKKHQERT